MTTPNAPDLPPGAYYAMDLNEFKEGITNLLQARLTWAAAEAYATDITGWMRRQGMVVLKRERQ